MDTLLPALCFCFGIANAPFPQVAHRAGDIWYTHERLRHTHLLRLSTTDFIVDWNNFRKERLEAFAQRFAAETCQGRYKLADAQRGSWPQVRTTYAMSFVFHCV